MTTQSEAMPAGQGEDGPGLWKKLLCQGLSARQLALAIAVGLTIGILPTVWGTSLLCFLLSWRLGLNQLAVQTVNYLVYPLQLALFMPFAICGRQICPGWFAPSAPFPWQKLSNDWFRLGSSLLPAQMSALVGWAALTPLCMLASYSLAFSLLKARERRNPKGESGEPHKEN